MHWFWHLITYNFWCDVTYCVTLNGRGKHIVFHTLQPWMIRKCTKAASLVCHMHFSVYLLFIYILLFKQMNHHAHVSTIIYVRSCCSESSGFVIDSMRLCFHNVLTLSSPALLLHITDIHTQICYNVSWEVNTIIFRAELLSTP